MEKSGDLRKWIRQTKPFAAPEAEAIISLFVTADRIREVAHAPLTEHHLSGEQYNVLRILRGAEPHGLRTYEVVGRLVSRAPNITRLVDKLEAKGLVERARSAEDRRVTTLRISDAGLLLLAFLDDPILRATGEAMRGLTKEEIQVLLGLLEKVRAPLARNEDGRSPDGAGRNNGG